MELKNINEESLINLSLQEKDNLKERLESNLRIQKMMYEYERKKIEKSEER